MLQEITLESEYVITDHGTSDGTQVKYFKDRHWYKLDRYGGEGEAEEVASDILTLSGFPKKKFVTYQQILINGQKGCVSKNFLKPDEQFVTFYRLFFNMKGRDLATVTSRMDYDDAIEFVLSFVRDATGLDVREYLANTFTLDALILNEDRHFNNMGIIFDGEAFREAPIFDNGKSFFIGNPKYKPEKPFAKNRAKAFAKAFSGSFDLNRKYLQDYATLRIKKGQILRYVDEHPDLADNIKGTLLQQINQ